MESLSIKQTKKSPLVLLTEGELTFEGCSIINDPKHFFDPIENWVTKYVNTRPEKTIININFEYIDSSSVKSLFDILKLFDKLGKNKVVINWHFDYADPEILELGEIIESRLKSTVNFIELT